MKAENYRPIIVTYRQNLQNCCKNIFMEHWDSQNVFRETLSTYMNSQCTTDNLIKLTHHVNEAFQWSEMVSLICFDVKNVFDFVCQLGQSQT